MKWIIVLYVLLVLHVQMESVAKNVLMVVTFVSLELVETQIVLTLVYVLVDTGAPRKAKNPFRAKLVHSLTMVPLMNAQPVWRVISVL